MSEIKAVAYIGKNHGPSDQFMAQYARLPPAHRKCIQIIDYEEIVRHLKAEKPSWLVGYPTMATYETNPTVWCGTKAIEHMTALANTAAAATPPVPLSSATARPQHSSTNRSQLRPPSAQTAVAPEESESAPLLISQSTNVGEFHHGCAATEDLYSGRMVGLNSSFAKSNKVTAADLASYNSQRDRTGKRQ